ncbi:MAG TPA: DinB family protein [Anaerolineae bacterium]|nr:DinB family protein [Anaerolineae bacterium]HMR62466.1 DinB family protein [Anaerolineae bacterium]
MSNQSAVNVLRTQYGQMQGWLNGTLEGLTDEIIHYNPPGIVSSIAGQLAHIVTGMDFFVLGLAAGQTPLFVSSFAEKSGISEPPPQGGDWSAWGKRVKVDMPLLNAYSQAVFAEVDNYLASLSDDDLQREKEFGPAGSQTVLWALNVFILNTYCHTGEIACIKGLKGLKGYPF